MKKEVQHINKFLSKMGEVEAVFSVDDNKNPLIISVYRKNADRGAITERLLTHAGVDWLTIQAVKLLKPEEAEEIKKIARIKTLRKELEELEKQISLNNQK
jgi:ribosome biogenesis SPOUT family RNA methylase Rps3